MLALVANGVKSLELQHWLLQISKENAILQFLLLHVQLHGLGRLQGVEAIPGQLLVFEEALRVHLGLLVASQLLGSRNAG